MRGNQPDVDRPLPRSLRHVARLGLRNSNAQGYAIDQLTSDGDAWVRKWVEGLPVPETSHGDLPILCFPLGHEDAETGALSYVLRGQSVSDEARRQLTQIASAAQSIWQLWQAPSLYARSVIRIAELEAELADSKISDRACALVGGGNLDFNPIDAISRSVESIIRPFQLGTVLNQLVRDLEQDLAEYELVRQAKAVLQTRDRMSEEQAYVYLRNASRSSRRRLGHVAREVIRKGQIKRADIRPLRLPATGSG
jgi:hypothetical protein